MTRSAFIPDFLLIFSGPIVWAIHFVAIYGWTGLICARPGWDTEWMSLPLIAWGVLGASVVAVAVIAFLAFGLHVERGEEENPRFTRWLTKALAGFSILAIVWETIPVFLVPACPAV